MNDVQNQKDERGIRIQQTGVNNVCLPFFIADGKNVQQVLATIKFTVALSKDLRGTHMSRLIEILTAWKDKPLALYDFKCILTEALDKLNTDAATLHLNFKYFVERIAPVSKKKSLLDINCFFDGSISNSHVVFTLGVQVPFTTLCPCSKDISDFGAHNQRSFCSVQLKFADTSHIITINDIVELIQTQASSPVYSILKREDEKFVTEAAYKNPKFVEDLLRDVIIAVRTIPGVTWFSVECENFESIHNHNAFAYHEESLS